MKNNTFPLEYERKTKSYQIGNLTIRIKSCFCPEKNLADILYEIASVRLKEKSA